MFHNTHATVGQSQGRVVLAAPTAQRAGASSPPSFGRLSRVPAPLPSRRGLSLTEVLIAMGILTVGLLGVASVFPVAAFYMQKGDVADRGSAIAQAAFNEVISNGTLDPERWLMWEDGEIKPAAPPLSRVPLLPGVSQTYSRRFADKLSQQLVRVGGDSSLTPTAKQWNVATEFGAAFVIDPMGAASSAMPFARNMSNKFPSTAFRLDTTANYYQTWWQPWYVGTGTDSLFAWPIRRLTIERSPLTPMSLVDAETHFTSRDDLVIDMPNAGDKPSTQSWQLANLDGGNRIDDPLARQSAGDYSWIVSVSPSNSDARDALAFEPSAFSYEVSVAVFHKRILGKSPTDLAGNYDISRDNERLVRAKVVSSGLNGGELLLEAVEPTTGVVTAPTESPFKGLKVGNWYMLAGPHPNSTATRPMFVARWYRVLAIEGKDARLDASGNPTSDTSEPERRLVSLRGPQWPWQPAIGSPTTALSNNLCFAIVPNVVAVHSKTVRLEGKSMRSIP